MNRWWVGAGILAALIPGGLALDRRRREREARRLARELEGSGEGEPFRPDMVVGLPEPARRFLLHAIAPGTPLATSVRLVLDGSMRLSRNGGPLPMQSREMLAPPRGLVWRARVGRRVMALRGYDLYADAEGRGEMRWWLWGFLPVARASGKALRRSAAGRLLGEAVFVPSVLLPSRGVRWQRVGVDAARFTLRGGPEEVGVTLKVAPSGALRRVSLPRWNNDPRNGPVGYVPFVCDRFRGERTFDGYTLPTSFRAGWSLGSPGEFPFFQARVREAEYR